LTLFGDGRANPQMRVGQNRHLHELTTSNLLELLTRWVSDCSVRPRRGSEKGQTMSRCDTTVLATVDAEVEAKRIYGEQRANLLNMGLVAAVSGV
jgi:hypothetical protein